MVKAMTKDTFSKATMLFDLQRLDPRHPLPRTISPTKSQRHQSDQLSQPFFVRDMRRFQTKASGLQTSEQSLDSPAPGIISKQQLALFTAEDYHILAITATHAHHKQPLPQDSARSPKQYSLPCLLCAKEVARRHPLAAARVLNQQVLFQAQAKGDPLATQVCQPIYPDEL